MSPISAAVDLLNGICHKRAVTSFNVFTANLHVRKAH